MVGETPTIREVVQMFEGPKEKIEEIVQKRYLRRLFRIIHCLIFAVILIHYTIRNEIF